jgi:NAD(P)-dependent dehydrogenase (short-subunit alcohol dehydrogenase family)
MASKNFFAVIAGVGAGTGRSLSLKFAQTYPVVLLSRSSNSYSDIVEEIKSSGGQAVGISTDVTDPASVKSAFETIKKEYAGKKLAAAVYNASGKLKRAPFLDLTLDDWEGALGPSMYV